MPDALQPHVNYFAAAKHDGGASNMHRHIVPRFFGTTIIEDVDSPAVLDGESTANLTYDLHSYFTKAKIDSESAVTTLDRKITYSRLLI